jgi:hypothetical protein
MKSNDTLVLLPFVVSIAVSGCTKMNDRGLTPRPKRACYALAAFHAGPPADAMTVLTDIGILKLPLTLYADDSFTTPVQYN